ncbi:PucR family transcriptional regulator ligand-binding domain-containing protein [Microbacterium trichothecenolyticum]|uniref:PucR family transcriptional regulator ligand-binding domain-containing protein n=1 Tax=Microbacterium ureisolvens TaxID=2781186 RepID=A0ABS7I1P9_9MICO|nr:MULTISPECIES: PucR family transcriptional regulator [Microbacterium]MBW9110413.1 PucR family transcriptional regulator ligand-binding domain-containing protein [Microbacterium ureisolvens]MBW9120518.1 PucR family transcriptional regulator ligand-binding domain-containing protein [Microbacterium trichothecenolyticum]
MSSPSTFLPPLASPARQRQSYEHRTDAPTAQTARVCSLFIRRVRVLNAFTIADLVSDPTLDTSLVSGGDGSDRTVLWAHSCEMEHPDKWLGPHELLMTIGLCIPHGAQQQRDLIARLDDAGLAGIAVGDDGLAPRLTKAMLSEADARGFPVLRTGPNTPFAAIGRTVAAANAERQTMSVLGLAKLYQVAGQDHRGHRRTSDDLGDLLGIRLTVVDDATGCVLLGRGALAPAGARAYPLRTHRPTHLMIDAGAPLDSLTLVHVTQILTVHANAVAQDAEARLRDGAAVLEQALVGRANVHGDLLRLWGQETAGYRAVATTCKTPLRLQTALAVAELPTTAIEADGRIVVVTPTHRLEELRSLVEEICAESGVSAVHRDLRDVSGAVAEATAEHAAVRGRGEHWREFQGEQVSLVARSRSEAAQIIDTVLGPLAREEQRYGLLRETLFAFLDNDLHWSVTAQTLGMHRQGLVYRLNRAEELTGRSVRRTRDVSELWLARTAWRQLREG